MEKDIIDLSKQHLADSAGFKEMLIELRRYLMDLSSDVEHFNDLKRFSNNIFILNWLIEDVEYIDK